ncbi:hypothetical protein CIG75_16275 [Tumebacillus algifaecis]|uniref:Amphi-Trp domain-containing protein n=1 Tax=Tumebacillus algifaecis TaxID=1214604 RepID=A0A223D415_9BACL|nr:hypothetical protein [Tumebacillus algifaecis]ASS76352.1 hypothetical protein CIG75_16275 [Tumebacillus algifaecis]
MSGTEIKIKRRDIMTAQSVADLLRRLADQIEEQHSFNFDGTPVMIANQVQVRQDYKKAGLEHKYALSLYWEEEFVDQFKLGGNENKRDVEHDQEDLPDTEDEVPPPPLDLPGTDDHPGIRGRE